MTGKHRKDKSRSSRISSREEQDQVAKMTEEELKAEEDKLLFPPKDGTLDQ